MKHRLNARRIGLGEVRKKLPEESCSKVGRDPHCQRLPFFFPSPISPPNGLKHSDHRLRHLLRNVYHNSHAETDAPVTHSPRSPRKRSKRGGRTCVLLPSAVSGSKMFATFIPRSRSPGGSLPTSRMAHAEVQLNS